MTPATRQWIERARYDFETAKGMLTIRKYLYAAFMCQQAVEKMLKAILTSQGATVYPIHNLSRLAQLAGLLELCDAHDTGLLAELTPYCIKARYGEYKRKLSELCNRATAQRFVKRTDRMLLWLEKKIGAASQKNS